MSFLIAGARCWALSPLKRTTDRRERSVGSQTGSFAHPRSRVSVFKSGPARTSHQFSRPERFVFAVITIELPAAQTAAGVDNFPAGAAEDTRDFRGRRFEHQTAPQSA